MKLHELSPAPGARTVRRRIGRGIGSGRGKTAGHGHKGQKARAGRGKGPHFEGGQTPLQRRLPKRGFTNIHRKQYSEVKLQDLNLFEGGATVTPEMMVAAGLVRKIGPDDQNLGNGVIEKALTVQAHGLQISRCQDRAAGGRVEVIQLLQAMRNACGFLICAADPVYGSITSRIQTGSYVPVPGVDAELLAQQLGTTGGNIFGF